MKTMALSKWETKLRLNAHQIYLTKVNITENTVTNIDSKQVQEDVGGLINSEQNPI